MSFLVGTATLMAYLLATRTPILLQGSLKLPAWVWAGARLGAIYVACFTLLVALDGMTPTKYRNQPARCSTVEMSA